MMIPTTPVQGKYQYKIQPLDFIAIHPPRAGKTHCNEAFITRSDDHPRARGENILKIVRRA